MGMRWRKLMILSVFAASGMLSALAVSPSWEPVKAERAQSARLVLHKQDLEVRTERGSIIISTQRPIQEKVFSILGQLVSQENLGAGTSRLELGVHGVYIVKIGNTTCKVAL